MGGTWRVTIACWGTRGVKREATIMDLLSVEEDGATASQHPLKISIALNGDDMRVADARHLAAGFLARCRDEHAVVVGAWAREATQLVVSELVTNAYKYAPGPVRLDLRITGGSVEVAVWDGEPVLPVVREADAGRVGQHGLEIVAALADGFEAHRVPMGKRITARISLADASGSGW